MTTRCANVRPASAGDLAEVARLHCEMLRDGFLPTLGPRFLEVAYRCMSEADSAVILVARSNDGLEGFVSGTTGLHSVSRLILRHPARAALALVPSAITPSKARGILRLVRYRPELRDGEARLPRAELLSIAVSPRSQGSGLAKVLVAGLERWFMSRGIDEYRIAAGIGLARAQNFYRRLGATEASRMRLHDGKDLVVFRKTVAQLPFQETC